MQTNSQGKSQLKARKIRRSRRVALQVAILVQQDGADGHSVMDDTVAVMVNKHGALIALTRMVQSGQKLLVINKKTKESKECRVAHIGPTQGERRWVGIEFTQAAPEFWGVSFPPMRIATVDESSATSIPRTTIKRAVIQ